MTTPRTFPRLARGSMTPAPWFGPWRGLLFMLWPGQRFTRPAGPAPAWHAAARRRRTVLLALVALLASGAFALRLDGGPDDPDVLWWTVTAMMTLLFAWAGIGTATAAMGAWAAWRGDPHAPRLADAHGPIDPRARTAIVMPICNEDVPSVFAGLRATCESLAATGALKLFDVFVLSDTGRPELRAAELEAYRRLCAQLGEPADGTGRIHYRWRRYRVKRKAGNVADWCRRWGQAFRYMIVLDADSTMSGDALVQMVRLMEAHPRTGILQTLPQVSNPTTLHARAQQFASRVTGRLFALGMAWWQLGDAHYWGHNAILRVEPFMKHCALARLPGRDGAEVLSHDFVEAAMMGRMGWEVWLAPQIEGSWEQTPPNLVDELQRDRRWCEGNLLNLRLVAEPGWRPAHRTMFAVGAFSYMVAPLWIAFIALGMAGGGPLRDDAALWVLTLVLLLLPRALAATSVVLRGEAAAFGGAWRLAAGALFELVMSSLQAPLRMLAHAVYVLGAVTGLKLEWKSPPRAAEALPWGDALRRVGGLVTLPLVAGLGVARRLGTLAAAPMLLPLVLAVPFTVLTAHPRVGRFVQRLGLMRLPEDRLMPRPLQRAADSGSFADLAPVSVVALPGPRRTPAFVTSRRLGWAASAAFVAVVATAMPTTGITPELPDDWQMRTRIALAWVPVATIDPPQVEIRRPRRALPEKPARMIDDALRQRAREAVERAIAAESSPA